MFKKFVDSIAKICTCNKSSTIIFDEIKNILGSNETEFFNKMINDEIKQNFSRDKLTQIVRNGSIYHKYNLYNSDLFDIVDIKWEKNSMSKPHDHPALGCIVLMYNNGKIQEYNLVRNSDGKIVFTGTKYMENGDIGYKIGNKNLHLINARKYSETVHVYVPGKHVTSYYDENIKIH